MRNSSAGTATAKTNFASASATLPDQPANRARTQPAPTSRNSGAVSAASWRDEDKGAEGPRARPSQRTVAHQREELLARGLRLAERAQHRRGDHHRVLLLHAAHLHAQVLRLDHH